MKSAQYWSRGPFAITSRAGFLPRLRIELSQASFADRGALDQG